MDQLYHDGGLSSLIVSLRRAFAELHQVEINLGLQHNNREQQRGGYYCQNNHRRMTTLPAISMARDSHHNRSRGAR